MNHFHLQPRNLSEWKALATQAVGGVLLVQIDGMSIPHEMNFDTHWMRVPDIRAYSLDDGFTWVKGDAMLIEKSRK